MLTDRPRRVVLDTDIGTDVDDAIALGVLLGSPEVELAGVLTAYGDAVLRARIARRLLRLAGRTQVPVVPGLGQPLSGREVWWGGHEGSLHDDLAAEPVDPLPPGLDGPGWLRGLVHAHPGEVEVLAVAPLTNVAAAVRADPAFAADVGHVWVMGGRFDLGTDEAEHNFASDAVAAEIVMGAGLPLTVLGLDITRQVRLADADVTAIGALGDLGRQLERETRQCMARWDEPYDVPHDAVTAVRMVAPQLFTGAGRPVRVETDRAGAGRCRHDSDGPEVEVVTSVDAGAVVAEIHHRLAAAHRNGSGDVPQAFR